MTSYAGSAEPLSKPPSIPPCPLAPRVGVASVFKRFRAWRGCRMASAALIDLLVREIPDLWRGPFSGPLRPKCRPLQRDPDPPQAQRPESWSCAASDTSRICFFQFWYRKDRFLFFEEKIAHMIWFQRLSMDYRPTSLIILGVVGIDRKLKAFLLPYVLPQSEIDPRGFMGQLPQNCIERCVKLLLAPIREKVPS